MRPSTKPGSPLEPARMKTILPKLLLAWLFTLLPAPTRAQIAVQEWVRVYYGPGNGDDYHNDTTRETRR